MTSPPSSASDDAVAKTQHLRHEIIETLKTYKSYWIRQSKMLALTKHSPLTSFQFQLVEFELALHFEELDNAANCINKIFSNPEASSNSEVDELMREFLLKSSKPDVSNYGAVRKIDADIVIKICAHVYAREMETSVGRLFVYTKMALLNPVTLQTTATSLWEELLVVESHYKPPQTFRHELLKEFNITLYDFLFLHISPALIQTNFGNLSTAVTFEFYRRLVNCTFFYSIEKMDKSFYDCSPSEECEIIRFLRDASLQRAACWNNCAGVLAAIYQKFRRATIDANDVPSGEPRDGVAAILIEHALDNLQRASKSNAFEPDVSFVQLVERLVQHKSKENVKNNFNVDDDAEVVRLLIFYSFSAALNARRKNSSSPMEELEEENGRRRNEADEDDEQLVLIPRYFCDISPKSILEFWQNDDVQELRLYGEETDDDYERILKDDSGNCVEAFRILFCLDVKFEILDKIPQLLEKSLRSGFQNRLRLRISSTLLQAHMLHANYGYAMKNFSKYEGMAAGADEERIFKIQYLQICVALNRHKTMHTMGYSAKSASSAHDDDFGFVEFTRFLAIFVELLPDDLKFEDVNRPRIPCEIFAITQENCYIFVKRDETFSYCALYLLQIIYCQLLKCLSDIELRRTSPNVDKLCTKIDLLNAFAVCTIQLLAHEAICYPVLDRFLQYITSWGSLRHPTLLDYISSPTLLSYIFALDESVKLDVTPNELIADNGAHVSRLFLNGTIPTSRRSYADNFRKFLADNQTALRSLFEE